MITKTNAHTHTTFCDGKNTPEEMVQAAIKKGFFSIGFSGHSHCEYDPNSMDEKRTLEYAKEILRLKEKHQNEIKIYLGIEQDSLTQTFIPPLDYKIGSVHFVKGNNGKYYAIDWNQEIFIDAIQNGFDGDSMALVRAYYKAVDEMLQRVKPDICGHLDLVCKMNKNEEFFSETSEEYKAVVLPIIQKYSQGVVFEINTGGVYRGYMQRVYPDSWILQGILRCGGKVMINTDCHTAQAIDFYIEQSMQLLKQIGFKSICILGADGIEYKNI